MMPLVLTFVVELSFLSKDTPKNMRSPLKIKFCCSQANCLVANVMA